MAGHQRISDQARAIQITLLGGGIVIAALALHSAYFLLRRNRRAPERAR